MEEKAAGMKITILKDGPYVVTGNVPLTETVITPEGKIYEMEQGKELPQSETYALCRCGKTTTPPFCDGAHVAAGFDGTETASMDSFDKRAKKIEGAGIDLKDDTRCALVRRCHMHEGTVWSLMHKSDDPAYQAEIRKGSYDCPAGRIVAVEKDGTPYDPDLEPGIEILQDPEKNVSSCIFVKGYIPVVSSEGKEYERRNRVALCRCGESSIKPFCDASHMRSGFKDY